MVAKLAMLLPAAECEDYKSRCENQRARMELDRKHADDLRAKISKVAKSEFLYIGDKWLDTQISTFRDGTQYYQGPAREIYCASAGLDRSFIENAQPRELNHALMNLGLPCGPPAPTAQTARQLLGLYLSCGYEGQAC
jgi:hypothetical protein